MLKKNTKKTKTYILEKQHLNNNETLTIKQHYMVIYLSNFKNPYHLFTLPILYDYSNTFLSSTVFYAPPIAHILYN